jgi:copper oxidase (laccase) domain-containing protein
LFQIEQFSGAGIKHAFFTRQGGMSSGIYQSLNCGTGSKDNKETVLNNRAKAMAALSLPSGALVTCHQTHSSEAITITNKNRNQSIYFGDGLIAAPFYLLIEKIILLGPRTQVGKEQLAVFLNRQSLE